VRASPNQNKSPSQKGKPGLSSSRSGRERAATKPARESPKLLPDHPPFNGKACVRKTNEHPDPS